MADIGSEVHITGSDLPEWATETTAVSIAETIAELITITKRQQSDIVNQLKKNGKISDGMANTLSKKSGLKNALNEDLKAAGHSALETAGGFDKLNKGPLKNFGAALKKSSLGFKAGLAGLGLLGQAIGKSIIVVKESTAAMRDMADSGITFAGGMVELQSGLADVGMTLAEVSEIAGKYSQVMGIHGFRAITQLTKSVNAADNGFMKYGLTTAEATEWTAEYLEQQRLGGVYQTRRAGEQAKAIQQNIERLTAYSKILNVSRKHMMETITTLKGREDVQARFAAMDAEQRAKANKAFDATIAAFTALGPKGEEFGTMLVDMLGNPIAEASETFKLLAQVSPELARQMADASRGVAAGIPVNEAQVKSMMELAQQNKGVLIAMSIQEGAIGEMAKKLLAASLIPEQAAKTAVQNEKAYQEAKRKNENLTREEFNKSVAGNIQTAAKLDDALNVLRATAVAELTKSFLNLVGADGKGGIEAAIKGLKLLTENISGLSDYAAKFRSWFGDGMGGMVAAFVTLAAVVSLGPMALVAGFMTLQKGMMKFSGSMLRAVGGLGAAAAAGYAVGTGINNVAKLWGGRQLSTTLLDTFTNFNDYDPNSTILTPEAQRMADDARAKRATNALATTSKEGSPTVTTPKAEASMSATDIAKLDIAGQQLYYTKRLVRLVETGGGMMA